MNTQRPRHHSRENRNLGCEFAGALTVVRACAGMTQWMGVPKGPYIAAKTREKAHFAWGFTPYPLEQNLIETT